MAYFLFFVCFIAWIVFSWRFLAGIFKRQFRVRSLVGAVVLFIGTGITATAIPTPPKGSTQTADAPPPPAHHQNNGFFHRLGRKIKAAVEPTADPQADEHAMLEEVEASVTPERVEGNASKYDGKTIKWRCTVSNVLPSDDSSDSAANAECDTASIVLTGDEVKSFDANQEVVVLGTVTTFDGTNNFGGEKEFPAVKVAYVLHNG